MAHSELGASIAKRWTNCLGSVLLTRGLPNTESDAAKRGTAAHEVAELCLRSGQDAAEFVDRTVADVAVTADMAEDVQMYLDEIRGWPDDGEPLMIEVSFDLSSFGPPAPMFGTADAVRYYPADRLLRIGDYKNGWVFVEATDNAQLKYYALGAMLAVDRPVERVEACIVQPNNGGVKRATFDAVELVEWSIWLLERAALALQPGQPLVAGDWCRFCPAAGRCPGQADAALVVATGEFATVPELLTPARVADMLRKVPLLRRIISDVENAAHALARAGDLPGFKLVPKRPTQRWRDPADAAFMLDGLDVPDTHEPPVLRSPAQIRERLTAKLHADAKAAGLKLTKKKAEADAAAALADLIDAVSSGENLVPETDDRPALPAPAAEFNPVEP